MQTTKPLNDNYLNLLRILYIVKACFNFLGMFFFIGYAFMGTFFKAMVNTFPNPDQNEAHFPEAMHWIFVTVGTIGAVVLLTFGILTLIAASKINSRQGYNFIFVVGILNCFTGMLGIALGVFTIIELSKPQVKALFQPQTKTPIGF
ncbi:hypothetical protein AAU57_06915 [Nonlabens sp. YIK11]|uniref:hypothetical protein n=1 Tax=Nonlabens sp. YIK11 TaxID=1453349 RepID=UPI0006DD14A5|nr:hypothetical protein [Nonlabens sp. YIK11]KQC33075.1 hypothetical protein AAU57_06915 [Nonlabens sp. YIK11]